MSHEPVAVAVEADPVQQRTPHGASSPAFDGELHPRLQEQVERARAGGGLDLSVLLPLISTYYQQLDVERRGVVRSMQLIADEARTFADGLAGADAGHLQAILDHIKDVVITVGADGAIKLFNPTGERVFGYSRAEVIGRSIAHLLPELPLHGSVERGLQAAAAQGSRAAPEQRDLRDLRPRELRARHKDGHLFAAELIASHVHLQQRDVYVLCLRDTSERMRAEQALRDSELRYRTLVESAPELIMVMDQRTGRYVDANESALRFFGISRERLCHLGPQDLSAEPCVDGADGRGERPKVGDSPKVFEWLHRDAHGNEVQTEVRLMALPGAGHLVRASITDIGARRRAEKITAGERNVFERIAADAPLPMVLEAITALVESVSRSFTAAIGCVDAQAHSFIEIIGARLPARWRAIEQGMPIDMRNGSSAAAVYLGRQVLVADVASDPFWQRRRELALELGFKAAWAVPIQAVNGRMLGAMSVYRPVIGAPQSRDLELIVHAARLAGIAIERRRDEVALRESEAKFRSLYERVLEGVYQCAPDGRLVEVNPAFVNMLGYANAAQVYALPGIAALYQDPTQRAELERALQEQGVIHNAEAVLRCLDGTRVVVLESARRVCDAEGQVLAYEGTMANITARKAAEQAMFAQKERAQVTLQSIGDAVITTDRDGHIDYMNPVAEQLTGWHSAAARGQKLGVVMRLLDELTEGELDNPLVRCLREGQLVHSAEHSVLVNRLGQEIAIHDSAAPIRDRGGEIVGAVVVFRDVTKERRLKRALSYQASHDALTGLINRRELDNRLADALRSAHEGQGPHALLYLDLDQFKRVNDACGHSAGDRLLRDVTGLLQAQVRAGDTIARLGGDEFGILMQRCTAEQAAKIAENIRQTIHDYRFIWEQHTNSIGASIGVVEITAECQSVASVLSAADIACYAAKDAGRNRVHLYDAVQASGRHRDLYWVGRVTRALEQGHLELFCQPIVATGAAASAHALPPFYELLTRLRDDDGELVLPRQFLPAAERYDVVSAIDRWALGSALQVLRERMGELPELPESRALPDPPALLALNLSATSLGERSFLDFALAQLGDPRIARGLCFEISEAAVLGNLSQALEFVRALKERGCRFALADFGRGMASFRYLRTLPVDFIKIDGQCIAGVTTDVIDRCMVEAISHAARALGISTIAEKVESAEIFAELQQLGVELAQGLFIGAPEPITLHLSGDGGRGAEEPPQPLPGRAAAH